MIFLNRIHEMLKYFMRRTTLILRIHHIQQANIMLKLFNKRSPLCFITDLTNKQFGLYHISELYSIRSLFHSLLFLLFLLISLLSFDYVFRKSVDSIQLMKLLITFVIFKLILKLLPSHVIFSFTFFKKHFQILDISLFLYLSLLFLLYLQLI